MSSKKDKTKVLLVLPIVVVLVLAVWGIRHAVQPKPIYVLGEMDARQIDVSSKIPGRIDSIMVEEGMSVTKGQVLVRLQSPELAAKCDQARAAVQGAKALYEMALHGARPQDIQAAREAYLAAQAQADFAGKTYERMKGLYEKKSISMQAFDEIQAKRDAAVAMAQAAREKWNLAVAGARVEDIEAARANYERAQDALREAESYLNEATIKAPASGEIDNLISDPGEMVASGYPVLSLVDLKDCWAVCYVSEDKLPKIKKSGQVDVSIPALGKETYRFEVSYIAPLADFASKKATTDQGNFDLKTFEIHLKPVHPLNDVRPGMSVRFSL